MFRITAGKGFHMEFSNGIVISVQFGAGNYCENRSNYDTYPFVRTTDGELECKNAEIAIWTADGKWITRQAEKEITGEMGHDDVLGYLITDSVARYIAWCQKQPDTHVVEGDAIDITNQKSLGA